MTEVITFSIPGHLRQKIDSARGEISRSRFISRILEKAIEKEVSK